MNESTDYPRSPTTGELLFEKEQEIKALKNRIVKLEMALKLVVQSLESKSPEEALKVIDTLSNL